MRFLVKMLAFLQFMDYEKVYIAMKGPAEKTSFFLILSRYEVSFCLVIVSSLLFVCQFMDGLIAYRR